MGIQRLATDVETLSKRSFGATEVSSRRHATPICYSGTSATHPFLGEKPLLILSCSIVRYIILRMLYSSVCCILIVPITYVAVQLHPEKKVQLCFDGLHAVLRTLLAEMRGAAGRLGTVSSTKTFLTFATSDIFLLPFPFPPARSSKCFFSKRRVKSQAQSKRSIRRSRRTTAGRTMIC